MTDDTKQCALCEKEFEYHEEEDKQNNELIPLKIRKVVHDGSVSVPFFAIPIDKQRAVGAEFCRYECHKCTLINEEKPESNNRESKVTERKS